MERLYSAKVYANYRNQYPKMTFVQGDTEVNRVKLEFYDDVNIPMANIVSATASVERPLGNTYTFGTEDFEITDNIVTFILPPAAVFEVGDCKASVSVYDSSGGRLTSDTFKYKVTDYLEPNTPVDETNEYPVLTGLIAEVNDLKTTYLEALEGSVEAQDHYEIVQARKGETNLRAKIDAIDAEALALELRVGEVENDLGSLQLVDTAVQITDTAGHLEATKLDGALEELYQRTVDNKDAVRHYGSILYLYNNAWGGF